MRLLVFAHNPPPLHGQSYMVQLLVRGLGGDARRRPAGGPAQGPIECYQVNARFSDTLGDVGRIQWRKPFLMLGYCAQALWLRRRYGIRALYYVPASTFKSAIYRDWFIMAVLRPFFETIVFHWHAVGLGEWADTEAGAWEQRWTRRALGRADLNIVLASFYENDVARFSPRRTVVVPNGIPDPCRDSIDDILRRRAARVASRARLLAGQTLSAEELARAGGDPQVFRVLCLSLLAREKGILDALDAVALLNGRLAKRKAAVRVRLALGGKFFREIDRTEFLARAAQPDLQLTGCGFEGRAVEHLGFVEEERKARLLAESDCFCFPSYWRAEGQPVALLEAMAYGLPIVAARWRAVPELFPEGYPGLVEPRSPTKLADALERCLSHHPPESLRGEFLARYTDERFIQRMTEALLSVERPLNSPPAA